MDFALVYFTDDKSYGAVPIASIKDEAFARVKEGSTVTVLGSSFDPVTGSQNDEEWSANIVKLGRLISFLYASLTRVLNTIEVICPHAW